MQLFGFPTLLEKEWHRLLTTVQGIGAKAGLAILGALGPEGVSRAITLGDARAIQAAPGVGPKLAQRVVLELKAKAPSVMAHGVALASVAAAEVLEAEPVAPRLSAPRCVTVGGAGRSGCRGRCAVGAGQPRLRSGRCGAGGRDRRAGLRRRRTRRTLIRLRCVCLAPR